MNMSVGGVGDVGGSREHSNGRSMVDLLDSLLIFVDNLFVFNVTINYRSNFLNNLVSSSNIMKFGCINTNIVRFGASDIGLRSKMSTILFHQVFSSSITFIFFNDFDFLSSISLLMVSFHLLINRLNDLLDFHSVVLTFNNWMNNFSNVFVMMFHNDRSIESLFNNSVSISVSVMQLGLLAFCPSSFLVSRNLGNFGGVGFGHVGVMFTRVFAFSPSGLFVSGDLGRFSGMGMGAMGMSGMGMGA